MRRCWKTVGTLDYCFAKEVHTVRQLDVRADVLHPIRRRFLLEVPNQAFYAVCNNLSNALGVRNSESAHAQPKLDAIHAAEQVRSIFRLSGPPG